LNQEDFDNLLAWLHPNRDLAAQKYHEIHQSLVKVFSWRGYSDAEELADEVVNRVSVRAKGFIEHYVGDPALYFYGVAKKILHECERRQPPQPLKPNMKVTEASAAEDQVDEGTILRECLQTCLRKLEPDEKEQILSYYRGTKQAKIDYRKLMAERLGIGTNALRVRVYRIRSNLKQCMQDCIGSRRDVK
jgi:RNA polymerase sigma factor (sigma-70 family)